MAKVDRKLFYRQVNDLYQLALSKAEQKNLDSVIAYWDRYYDDEDERLLASVLATVHYRSGKMAASDDTADGNGVSGLSKEQLRERFQVDKEVWLEVSRITADTEWRDTDPHLKLANMFYTALGKLRPLTLAQVLSEELKHVKGDASCPNDTLEKVFKRFHASNLTALCVSGGGIRSATFGLGIVQALASEKLLGKFDYLSTVSGGGYLGSWLSAWTRRERVWSAARFRALAATSTAEGAVVVGLSDIQIVVLRVLIDSATDIRTIGELQAAASHVVPDPKKFSPTQIELLSKLASDSGKIGNFERQFDILRSIKPEQRDILLEDPKFHNTGINTVQNLLSGIESDSPMQPTVYPSQLRRFREQINYVNPEVSLFSADMWALVAIYLRNLFLNLLIFVPLIAAVLMLPRFLFLLNNWDLAVFVSAPPLLLLGAGLGASVSIAFILNRMIAGPKPFTPFKWSKFAETDTGVVLLGVVPFVISGLLLSTLFAGMHREGRRLGYTSLQFPWGVEIDASLGDFIVGAIAVYFVGLGVSRILRYRRARTGAPVYQGSHLSGRSSLSAHISALVACVAEGVLLWLLFDNFPLLADWLREATTKLSLPIYVCIFVPVFLLTTLISMSVFVILTSRTATDGDREWLARYAAWIIIVAGIWILLNALVLLGPPFVDWLIESLMSFREAPLSLSALPGVVSVATAIGSAIIALVGALSGKSLVAQGPDMSATSRLISKYSRTASAIFLGTLLLVMAYSVNYFISQLLSTTMLASGAVVNHLSILHQTPLNALFVILLSLLGFSVLIACFVDVNTYSLHAAYRNRLIRAFLGASNPQRDQNTITGFDNSDNLELHSLAGQRPFHVINATVNLVNRKYSGQTVRTLANFTMTPLHCGSWAVRGYRSASDYCRHAMRGSSVSLGTAMAISGATLDPKTGYYYSSPVVSFVMALLNVRLGWWLGNPGPAGSALGWFGFGKYRYYERESPFVSILPLLNETFGHTDEKKRFLMVTDGGHFENLGLYEMVLRRCSLIVVSDGAADESFTFGHLVVAINRCRAELGVDIDFLAPMNILSRQHKDDKKNPEKDKATEKNPEEVKVGPSRFAIARITYPETHYDGEGQAPKHNLGWLIYARPTYYRTTEPVEIQYYADTNEAFPHESIKGQLFSDDQFEAYRGLGYLTMSETIDILRATAKDDPHDQVEDRVENLFVTESDLRKVVFNFFELGEPEAYHARKKRVESREDGDPGEEQE